MVPRMCGIPVRGIFTEYDHEYELLLEDFKDTDGNVMEPVTICVHKKREWSASRSGHVRLLPGSKDKAFDAASHKTKIYVIIG